MGLVPTALPLMLATLISLDQQSKTFHLINITNYNCVTTIGGWLNLTFFMKTIFLIPNLCKVATTRKKAPTTILAIFSSETSRTTVRQNYLLQCAKTIKQLSNGHKEGTDLIYASFYRTAYSLAWLVPSVPADGLSLYFTYPSLSVKV